MTFSDVIGSYVLVYLDDILVFGEVADSLLEHVRKVLAWLREH